MIYTFRDMDNQTTLEVERNGNQAHVSIFVKDADLHHQLSKSDIYHLIGALHLIQKELKEVSNG